MSIKHTIQKQPLFFCSTTATKEKKMKRSEQPAASQANADDIERATVVDHHARKREDEHQPPKSADGAASSFSLPVGEAAGEKDKDEGDDEDAAMTLSERFTSMRIAYKTIQIGPVSIAMDNVLNTVGLNDLVSKLRATQANNEVDGQPCSKIRGEGVMWFPVAETCAFQMVGACRNGEMCNHIHVVDAITNVIEPILTAHPAHLKPSASNLLPFSPLLVQDHMITTGLLLALMPQLDRLSDALLDVTIEVGRICRFFVTGKCRHGNGCVNMHVVPDYSRLFTKVETSLGLIDSPSSEIAVQRVCTSWRSNRCRFGLSCNKTHIIAHQD